MSSAASIHALYTSTGSDKKFIVVWNLSEQTRQEIKAEFLDLSLKKLNRIRNYLRLS